MKQYSHLWHPNHQIFLTKYQLSVYLCLFSAEKINFLWVNQQKYCQLKLLLRNWKKSKQNLVKKIFGDPRNFGGSDATNELLVSSIFNQIKKFSNEVSAKHQPFSVIHVSNWIPACVSKNSNFNLNWTLPFIYPGIHGTTFEKCNR